MNSTRAPLQVEQDLENGKQLEVAELHVDLKRLIRLYLYNDMEEAVAKIIGVILTIATIILVILKALDIAGVGDEATQKRVQRAYSVILFWTPFFLLVLTLCTNFLSDRKDKMLVPYVKDFIDNLYPDFPPTFKNMKVKHLFTRVNDSEYLTPQDDKECSMENTVNAYLVAVKASIMADKSVPEAELSAELNVWKPFLVDYFNNKVPYRTKDFDAFTKAAKAYMSKAATVSPGQIAPADAFQNKHFDVIHDMIIEYVSVKSTDKVAKSGRSARSARLESN